MKISWRLWSHLNRLAAAALAICACGIAIGDEPATDFNPQVRGSDPVASPSDQQPVGQRVELELKSGPLADRIEAILAEMTLEEKVGQLNQVAGFGKEMPASVTDGVRRGTVGSVFYVGFADQSREIQRVAREESRLGIPLLIPRDVIHGFRTVFPIPLGQAASWNPELVQQAAAIAAAEARAEGVNWTFAPMLDVSRDARWGRVAESPGEDPVLASALARAMVAGFQGAEEQADGTIRYTGIAACAKHFVGYGLSEGGRDYNRVEISTSELHNVFLPPFHAAIDSGCLTVMSGFSAVNGVPPTGNHELLTGVLKQSWDFSGLVVSDWSSVTEMIDHGFALDRRDAAQLSLNAGLDMEMATDTFAQHLASLVRQGRVDTAKLDDAVRRVLRVKLLVANDQQPPAQASPDPTPATLEVARKLAQQSVVLLKNHDQLLPLDPQAGRKLAIIGPLATAARDQLGCWTLDAKESATVTVAEALASEFGATANVAVVPGLKSSIDESTAGFADAVAAAKAADVVVLCVGEGWQLSGEARCRASLDLPGAQRQLVEAIAKTGKPLVMVVLTGRPLTIGHEVELADAVLCAWHPGTMGGPAIADLVTGKASPSGKLPITFPKQVGQVPLYYNHPRTGRPPVAGTQALLGSGRDDYSNDQKYRSHYLDVEPDPLFPFGFGLSYTRFTYGEPELSQAEIDPGQVLSVRATVTNTGDVAGDEVAQLYLHDMVGRIVRPVRQLKAFRRVSLAPGETALLEFALTAADLGYHDNRANFQVEPGRFRVGIGGDSTAPLTATFTVRPSEPAGTRATQFSAQR